MTANPDPDLLLRLREALAASWDNQTSYRTIEEAGNNALGQCYPTARVVQHFFPETKILDGTVQFGEKLDRHFWNAISVGDDLYHIDLTWQQFPAGSIVKEFAVLENPELTDGDGARQRCALLLQRVKKHMTEKPHDKTNAC